MREQPAAIISAVVPARHIAGYGRAGVRDGEGVAGERRRGAGQAKRESAVGEVVDARSEKTEQERQRQDEAKLLREAWNVAGM